MVGWNYGFIYALVKKNDWTPNLCFFRVIWALISLAALVLFIYINIQNVIKPSGSVWRSTRRILWISRLSRCATTTTTGRTDFTVYTHFVWHAFYLCLSHIQPRPPYDFYHPYDFLPIRSIEAPVGILHRCCSRGHISNGPRTVWHGCALTVWSNNSQNCTGIPCGHRTSPVRESSMFFISYGARAGPAKVPYDSLTDT